MSVGPEVVVASMLVTSSELSSWIRKHVSGGEEEEKVVVVRREKVVGSVAAEGLEEKEEKVGVGG
eukprot:gene8431-10019_t